MSIRPLALGLRAALALVAIAPAPLSASGVPHLRGDVTARRDSLTVGELIENAPANLADTPLFRAPALGQTGTIQASRIAAAAGALGLPLVETGGRLQVVITRAARRVGAGEIEAALKKALAAHSGLDPIATGITFDGPEPSLTLAPDAAGEVHASEVSFDRRARRMSATIWVGRSATERVASLRVTGSVAELVEVAVATRALERNETVKPSDIALERRPREAVSSDAVFDAKPLAGRVARRALGQGSLLRPGDLARPELVVRGEVVTAVYETPGISLAMRVKAVEGGALGDSVAVLNPASKKTLQAVVVGPGRVSVHPNGPERVSSAALASNP
jgi:flagella basal body P-ring formation protein FlgA